MACRGWDPPRQVVSSADGQARKVLAVGPFRATFVAVGRSAVSGVTHRSNTSPHGHATVSRSPFHAGSVAPPSPLASPPCWS
jgi:hypothetical protein